MKKADPEVTHSEEISPAELDAMAIETETHVADMCAVEGDDLSDLVVVQAEYRDANLVDIRVPPPARHALDDAPLNSKIVKLKEGAILATPEGAKLLPSGDPAHGLPEGARIFKSAANQYEATQLSAVEEHPVLETDSASSAIAQFIAHFHPTN